MEKEKALILGSLLLLESDVALIFVTNFMLLSAVEKYFAELEYLNEN